MLRFRDLHVSDPVAELSPRRGHSSYVTFALQALMTGNFFYINYVYRCHRRAGGNFSCSGTLVPIDTVVISMDHLGGDPRAQ